MGALLGIGALLALAVAFSATSDEQAPIDIANPSRKRRGCRPSSRSPLVKFDRIEIPFVKGKKTFYRCQVVQTPSEIRAQIATKLGRPVSSDAVALATMIASEQGSDPPFVKVAVANAALNYARYKKFTDVEDAITHGSGPERSFGGQLGRYASTNEPPTIEDVRIAEGVISGVLRDTTGGAIQFDSPRAQLALLEKHAEGYVDTPEKVATKRGKLEEFHLPGVDPMHLRFWRPRLTS
jgi:hypothetical protein